jgi:hypothetical protein
MYPGSQGIGYPGFKFVQQIPAGEDHPKKEEHKTKLEDEQGE